MIANLPLLFANGNPTALNKITASELEKFISFMVTCSWGHDTARDIRQPPWWPNDVEFSHPFVRPDSVPKDWEARLKNLVRKCYDYHKSAFLLVFSAQLARYPRKRLRYVDNHDHTTSLYYRPNSRLLVTFRNENLYYDKDSFVEIIDDDEQVKSADIYLCDNCDSHFDNFNNLKVHERLCNSDLPSSSCSGSEHAIGGRLPEFLSALKLKAVNDQSEQTSTPATDLQSKPRNSRTVTNIDRGPPYPFSSLAYMRNTKNNIQRDMSYSRERIERYCSTSTPISKNVGKSKNQQFPIRYRRPIDYWNRKYVFPNQRNKKILDLNAQLLLLKCRPVSVDVERMSAESMEEYVERLRVEAANRAERSEDVVYVDSLDDEPTAATDTRDPLTRAATDCEVIDLCSDDEGAGPSTTCLPRAGVACVMRGGAVLRRTAAAAAPLALPSEPCGARHLPALLHPHPVILITHTLNALQTISLE